MPIHPIGQKNRKGKLGSHYAVKDYKGVNPEFGTKADFKALVDTIHGLGMHVIIDWVSNHSAWDNPLAAQHPDWHTHAPEGDFQPRPGLNKLPASTPSAKTVSSYAAGGSR